MSVECRDLWPIKCLMESMQKIRTTAARGLCIWQAERLILHPSRMESAPVRGYRQTMVLIRF